MQSTKSIEVAVAVAVVEVAVALQLGLPPSSTAATIAAIQPA
jgi:hypothetical protein